MNDHLFHKSKLKDAKEPLMVLLITLSVRRGCALLAADQSVELSFTPVHRQLHFYSGNGAQTNYCNFILFFPLFFFP